MRLKKIVRSTNWRYALGELLLIVVGVSIALAASSWYEGRKDRARERDMLYQLRETLQADYETLRQYHEHTRIRAAALDALLQHLDSNTPYDDELPAYFRALNGWRGVRMRAATFESLKESGLELITNDELRFELVSLYEDHFAMLQSSADNDQTYVVSHSLPYFLVNFRRVENQNWIPHDYDRIKSDGVVANLARWRENNIRLYQLPSYARTLKSIERIVELINQQIDEEPS